MLTKEERAAITERAASYNVDNLCYTDIYACLFGKYPTGSFSVDQLDKAMIDRIIDLCDTSNMIELPRDKNGEAIKVGDVLYDPVGVKRVARGYMFYDGKWRLLTSEFTNDAPNIRFQDLPVDRLTHKKPVTNKSLASDIKCIANQGQVDRNAYEELFRIAWALERLGDSDD